MIPEIKKISNIDVLKHEEYHSKNGVKICTINTPDVDVVRISMVFNGGTKYQSKFYTASTTASMISEGCGEYSAQKVAEMLDFYGIYFDSSVDRDFSIITVCALTKFIPQAIELLEKMLLEPHFPEHEFEVYKSKRKISRKIDDEKVDSKAREAFIKNIFGENHPYGKIGTAEQYDLLTTDDLNQFFATHYNQSNLFVVMSGNTTAETVEAIAQVADKMPKGEKVQNIDCSLTTTETSRQNIEFKGAVQSAIRIGRVLFDRSHPDFVALQVASTILGGYFSSRLMSSLREEHGYTYGAYSMVANTQCSGYFVIATEVDINVTEEAIAEIFNQINILRTTLVDSKELDMVKRVMLGEILRVLDGPFGIADVTIENIQNGNNNSYTEHVISQINSISEQQILDIFVKYFAPESLTIVVAGLGENNQNEE